MALPFHTGALGARLAMPALWLTACVQACAAIGLAFAQQPALAALCALSAFGVGYAARMSARARREIALERATLQEGARALAAEHERMTARVVALRAGQTQFLAQMSHELRTPLNGMIGYAEILEEDLSGAAANDARRIGAAGRRLMALFDHVLDISALDLGGVTLKPERAPLREMIEEVAALHQSAAAANDNRIDLHLANAPETIEADPRRLRQCLIHLVDNACKFTRCGIISIEAKRVGDDVAIRIRDSGPGIDPELVTRLFEPFVRGDARRAPDGAGLGLAISRRLARLMGGDVTVVTAPGQGAIFTLTAPLAPAKTARAA